MRAKHLLGRVSFFLLGACLPVSSLSAALYSLTVLTDGAGTVSLNPTYSLYPEGAVVTATAAPAEGWNFREWNGDETGTTNPLNVTVSTNKVITAVFEPSPRFALTTATEGIGTVTLDPPIGPYLSNAVVTATASAAAGWVFVNWGGDANGNANPLSVTMTTNKALTGVFAQLPMIEKGLENQSAEVGGTVNFSVQAVGTLPLSYQWWFNNTELPGATDATLTLTNIQLNQEGTYWIVLTNAYGATSNSARLTLSAACSGTNIADLASEAALRQAIEIGGVVRLCFNGTVSLSNTIAITRDVALDARDRSVIISGNHSVRLFSVSSGVRFSATNVVFANGRHAGQDGTNSGSTIDQPASSGLPGEGGAILNEGGIVQLISCVLSNNSVIGGKGGSGFGIQTNGVSGEGHGGAILIRGGSLLLDSVTVVSNVAFGGRRPDLSPYSLTLAANAFGGAIYISNGTASILNCDLRSNSCSAAASSKQTKALGGAIFLDSGSVTFSNTSLSANSALGEAAPTSSYGFLSPGAAYGGAVAGTSGTLEVSNCQVGTNVAIGGDAFRHSGTGEAQGGGFFSTANLRVWDSTFAQNGAFSGNYSSENTDGHGGALCNAGSASIERCTFRANAAVGAAAGSFGSPGANFPAGHGLGGAIYNSSNLSMTNCTLTGNTARGGNSSIYLFGGSPPMYGSGLGGGVFNSNGVVHAVNVTLAGNGAVGGYSLDVENNGFADGANVANGAGTFALRNSILAYPGTNGNAWGTITDAGFNMSSDGSANFSSGSSFNFTDPRLLPLADNGGPTPTMALATNSPAVDFGAAAGAPVTDQRGSMRPALSAVDIGAYELSVAASSIPTLSLAVQSGGLRLSFEAAPNARYELQSCRTLTNWTTLEVIGPLAEKASVERPVGADANARFFRLLLR